MLPRRLPLAAMIVALGSCAAPRTPGPAPAPIPMPVPAASPARLLAADWRDWPVTPGDWRYAATATGSSATFGSAAAPLLVLTCDRVRRTMRVAKTGTADSATVRTSSSLRALPLRADGSGFAVADLPATDPLLDAMGFSRGRFVVEQAGTAPLVVPAWPEILRVTEDCRG